MRTIGPIGNEQYTHAAEDERLVTLPGLEMSEPTKWTLRGLDAKVLRTYGSSLSHEEGFRGWAWQQDYVYRGSSLLASHKPDQVHGEIKHFHLDHLGPPRLTTTFSGEALESKKYLPYGEELTTSSASSEVMRFTGHERDEEPAEHGNDLDYMHARFYSPKMGRFLSLDPILGSPGAPQSWNRYAYVGGNPINFVDPFGLQRACTSSDDQGNTQSGFCDEVTVSADISTTNPDVRDVGIGGDISVVSEDTSFLAELGARRGEGFTPWQSIQRVVADQDGEIPDFETYSDCVDAGYCRMGMMPMGPGAARAGIRTAPRNLSEKLALDQAKAGAGRQIMQGKIKDLRFPEKIWAKIEHIHRNPDGTKTIIHYWKNLVTGIREGFK